MNTRWWETYLVRYITGSVVGAVIVYQILSVSSVGALDNGLPKWFELKPETLVMLGVVGFAYCYIASAPITFLHAIRVGGEGTAKVSILLPFTLILSIPILIFLLTDHFPNDELISLMILYATLSVCWVAIGLRIVKYQGWEKSYERLIIARTSRLKRSSEFVDSYRHLREHGNAFYIVLMELILAPPLIVFAHKQNWTLFVVTLGLWLIPGAICWYLGNSLESYMTSEHQLQRSPFENTKSGG